MFDKPKNSNSLADVDYEALVRQARQERAQFLATFFKQRRPPVRGHHVRTAGGRLKIVYSKNRA